MPPLFFYNLYDRGVRTKLEEARRERREEIKEKLTLPDNAFWGGQIEFLVKIHPPFTCKIDE